VSPAVSIGLTTFFLHGDMAVLNGIKPVSMVDTGDAPL
jgi:hypothetical protein